jgi:hypothetical protein
VLPEGFKPWDIFEEVVENSKAHIKVYSCPRNKDLFKAGWNPREVATAESGLRLRIMRDKEWAKRDAKDAAKREARAKMIANETPEQKVKREAKEQKKHAKELEESIEQAKIDRERREALQAMLARKMAKKKARREWRAARKAAGKFTWHFQLFTGENFFEAIQRDVVD